MISSSHMERLRAIEKEVADSQIRTNPRGSEFINVNPTTGRQFKIPPIKCGYPVKMGDAGIRKFHYEFWANHLTPFKESVPSYSEEHAEAYRFLSSATSIKNNNHKGDTYSLV